MNITVPSLIANVVASWSFVLLRIFGYCLIMVWLSSRSRCRIYFAGIIRLFKRIVQSAVSLVFTLWFIYSSSTPSMTSWKPPDDLICLVLVERTARRRATSRKGEILLPPVLRKSPLIYYLRHCRFDWVHRNLLLEDDFLFYRIWTLIIKDNGGIVVIFFRWSVS